MDRPDLKPTADWARKYADFLETLTPQIEAMHVKVGDASADMMSAANAHQLNIAALREFAEMSETQDKQDAAAALDLLVDELVITSIQRDDALRRAG
ncbi:hypothetical protein [Hyphobacterium sp.]|uniref:hypothetical protein n=1 Tax=Hyphobacterium sp. TaxID=2004662 RepID=UPI003BAAA04A